jgi:AcrR family transcriptional regulator
MRNYSVCHDMKKNPKIKIQDTRLELLPRKKPAQRRAEETLELILETSAQLLDKVGLDEFNTNLLAEHAGLRVSTVYRYFPNKLAILTALVQNLRSMIIEELTGVGLNATDSDWRGVIYTFIDTYVAITKKQSGFFAIRRAMQSAPKLREIEKEMVTELSASIATLLKEKGVELKGEDLNRIIQVFLIAGVSVYDLAWLKGKKDKTSGEAIIKELKVMTISYLENYCSEPYNAT